MTIDIQIKLCDTEPRQGMILAFDRHPIDEEVVPIMDSSTKRSAAASLLALR